MAGQPRSFTRALSRRRLMQAAGTTTAALGGAALLACGNRSSSGGPSRSPSGSSQQAKKGGTLVRASTNKFDAALDPHPIQPVYTSFYTLWYQTLLRLNARSIALEPELAAKWEQPSPTEYVFHLQPNVKFHNRPPANGRPMTADDVVYSLNRVRTDDPRFQNRLLLSSVDKIEAPD